MSQCDCFESKKRQPRQKRVGPYTKINAYSQSSSCEQILTIIIFLIQLTLQSVFVVPPLPQINHTILWIMLGVNYALLILIIIDYFYLTLNDPVDQFILNIQQMQNYGLQTIKFCIICDSQVKANSHHCQKCNRCTEDFDHHCKFLNNCIGSKNYQAFFRLLLIYTLYNLNLIGMTAWVCYLAYKNEGISFSGTQGGLIALGVWSILILLAVGSLLLFHCYITCCQNTTTFDVLRDSKKSSEGNKNKIKQEEIPVSGQRLRRQQGSPLF